MAFVNIIKDLEWRSFWIIQVGAVCNGRCPYKRHPKKRQRREDNMKTGAEIGMLLTTKKTQKLKQKLKTNKQKTPKNTQSWKRQGKEYSLEHLKNMAMLNTWILDLLNCGGTENYFWNPNETRTTGKPEIRGVNETHGQPCQKITHWNPNSSPC